MASVNTLSVLDHPRRQMILTHRCDHIVGELRPGSDLVDEPVDLRAKLGMLLIRLPLTPPLVVQIAPPVNEFKHAGEALMGESIVHLMIVSRSVSALANLASDLPVHAPAGNLLPGYTTD
jgi:hypothetical protein